MKLRLLAAATAAALVSTFAAGSASALVITHSIGPAAPVGQSLITEFNVVGGTTNANGVVSGGTLQIASGFQFLQSSTPGGSFIRDGSYGLWSGVSAPPPGVTGNYQSVQGNGGDATLIASAPLTQFSFYLGSPDTYNTVTFTFVGVDGDTVDLSGAEIWGDLMGQGDNGDQAIGYRINYAFDEAVSKITFNSGTTNAFEFDSFYGVTAVPEPGAWALMILGFGGAGAMLRRRRGLVAA